MSSPTFAKKQQHLLTTAETLFRSHGIRRITVEEICQKAGVSKATFYKWKAKYGGMSVSEVKRMKELEEENRRLKQMYANLSLEHEILKDIIEKKLSK